MGKTKLETRNIIRDVYDDAQYDKMAGNKILGDTIKKGKGDYPLFPALSQDIFNAMFKYAPRTVPEQDIAPLHRLNRPFVEDMIGSDDFHQLRAKTKLDPVQAAMATASFADKLLADNKALFAELKSYLQSLKKELTQLEKLQAQASQLKKRANDPKATPAQRAQGNAHLQLTQQKIAGCTKTAGSAQAGAHKCVQQICSKDAITKGLKEANDVVNLQDDLLGAWGIGAGIFSPVNYEQRMKVANMLLRNKRLREIARLAGRFTRLAQRKQKQKVKHAMEEVAEIHQSDDIARLVPSEAMLLAEPELDILFTKKFVERQLLTYRLEGEDTKAKGPMVICFDVSGSMEGTPDTWCKAVAIALVQVAQKEKRSAFIIPFDHVVQTTYSFMKHEGPQPERLLEMASFFTGGGTSFDPPLKEAMKAIESEPNLKGADIILITDGAGQFSSPVKVALLELKQRLKFSMYTVVIGGHFNFQDHPLKQSSDYLWPVDQLTDDTAATIFEAV